MLSYHRLSRLPLCLPHWTVPCRIVLAGPDDRVTCPYHFSLRLFAKVRRSSYGPMAFPILAFTSSLVMWSLYEIPRSLRKHLISNACILHACSTGVEKRYLVTEWQVHLHANPHKRYSACDQRHRATGGETVSMSAFLACHLCYCAGSGLAWGLNPRAVVCDIFWSSSPGVFSRYSGSLPSFIGLMVQPIK